MTHHESDMVGHDAKIKEKTKGREWKIPECITGLKVNTVCESVSIMSQCVCVCLCVDVFCTASYC